MRAPARAPAQTPPPTRAPAAPCADARLRCQLPHPDSAAVSPACSAHSTLAARRLPPAPSPHRPSCPQRPAPSTERHPRTPLRATASSRGFPSDTPCPDVRAATRACGSHLAPNLNSTTSPNAPPGCRCTSAPSSRAQSTTQSAARFTASRSSLGDSISTSSRSRARNRGSASRTFSINLCICTRQLYVRARRALLYAYRPGGAGTITAPGSTFGIPKCPLMCTRSIGRNMPET